MSKQTDEKRELLKLKQGLIDSSEIIEQDVQRETEPLSFPKRVENFLYRNFFYVLAGAVLAVAAVIMTAQLLSKEAADITVLFVTSDNTRTPTMYQKTHDMELALEQYCPDFDGNGNIHVDVYFIDLSKNTADANYINTNNAKFYGEIQRGVAELFICDEDIFAGDTDEGFSSMFMDIGEITGDEQYSGVYSVQLKGTALAKDAKWENTCPEVLGLSIRREEEGMISYSESSVENNRKAQEVLINILTENRVNTLKEEISDNDTQQEG